MQTPKTTLTASARPEAAQDKYNLDLLWQQAFAFAHCNCPPDEESGLVTYHSNCARKLRPILEQLQAATEASR